MLLKPFCISASSPADEAIFAFFTIWHICNRSILHYAEFTIINFHIICDCAYVKWSFIYSPPTGIDFSIISNYKLIGNAAKPKLYAGSLPLHDAVNVFNSVKIKAK